MYFKKLALILLLSAALCPTDGSAREVLSLDTCRARALRNNKSMQIARERINAADYTKKEAFAAYLPALDFTGTYLYNQKELSLLAEDQMLPTKSFDPTTGSYNYNLVTGADGKPLVVNGQYVPSQTAVIPKEAMTFDIHNIFAGAVTLTQPLYMGGKIRALNKMAELNQELQGQLLDNASREVVYAVDAAYWQVVSLREKKKLATSYIELLDTLHNNVSAMIRQGIATNSDLLTVEVKQNEANIDLTKVDNGLALSKMALAQLCGMPMTDNFTLVDEVSEGKRLTGKSEPSSFNMDEVYANRPEIKSLQLATQIYEQKAYEARSLMLPTVALVGSYSFSNPNMFNGFEKKFNGMFSVGAMVKIPLWHWGGNYYKYKAAHSERIVKELELEEAKEKVELQVNQASYKTSEAAKTFNATQSNLAKADENLRQAQLGYKEGVMTLDNVMAAQTAWLKANSENIDAKIDVELCDIYLSKVTGTLAY